jgi:glycosyltransferase involved in cell wall biosynthesis
MRFHVVGLPYTQTTDDYPACAFTMKVRKFAKMMHNAGHDVYLYSGEENTTPCTEHIPCVSRERQQEAIAGIHYTQGSFDNTRPEWVEFNTNAIVEISRRAQPKDFICVIGGWSHKPIADALPHLMTVEFGIGYPGTFAKYRVFESYAWMHTVYGTTTTNAATLDGNFYDAVIHGYIDEDEFTLGYGKGDEQGEYLMFIGRLIERKGYQIAADVAEHLGQRLIVAGVGTPPSYGEYVGPVGVERAELYRNASAIFAPTLYVEPYGTVIPEALMCGTPAITTDWGAFTETVEQGVTGYRCRTLGEFVEAAIAAPKLDRQRIRDIAFERFSLERTAVKYEQYFHRLLGLWDEGWYTIARSA